MIVLFGSNPCFALPEASPFVSKAEVHLQMAGLAYEKQPAFPHQSPKGQIPFLEDDGATIADSHFIRQHIEQKYAVDLDAGLTDRQRAEAWAIERMVENHLNGPVMYTRWLMEENFAKGPGAWFADGAMRADIQQRTRERMMALGVTRHSDREITELAARSMAALAALLEDKPFLFGDAPTGTDAIAFAVMAAALTPHFSSGIRDRAESFPTLTAYVSRMMARFYPAHAWGDVNARLAA
jgi:glutathione S-transferase